MESGDLWKLILFFVCLVFSAFFSSSETAFIAFPRPRLLRLVNDGNSRANLVSRLIGHPERLLATVLLSNNLTNTAAAALGTALAINLIHNSTVAVLVSTFGVTFLLLVFSETLPKTVAWKRSETVAMTFARPLAIVQWVLSPAVHLLQLITLVFTKMVGISGSAPRDSEQEIRTLITVGAQEGEVEQSEAELLEKVFRFGDQRVMEIMTPRPEIIWIREGTTLKEFLSTYCQYRHTRFPVYTDTTENVIGLISIKDLLQAMGENQMQEDDPVTTLLRPAMVVPETKLVRETFAEMQESGQGMVLTIDEFGGIAGLVTLEQLLEIIVGDVTEEGEPVESSYSLVRDHVYRVDAGMPISEVNGELGLTLPEGQYNTLAGFMLEKLGRVPEPGDWVGHAGLVLTVCEMDGVRIAQVEVEGAWL